MLSKDVSTEFRGRGDVIHVYPLSFSEFYSAQKIEKTDAYNEYTMFGGMPYLLKLKSDEDGILRINPIDFLLDENSLDR